MHFSQIGPAFKSIWVARVGAGARKDAAQAGAARHAAYGLGLLPRARPAPLRMLQEESFCAVLARQRVASRWLRGFIGLVAGYPALPGDAAKLLDAAGKGVVKTQLLARG